MWIVVLTSSQDVPRLELRLDDDLLIDKIMMGLPADYDTLQTALDTIDESKSKLTLPNLTAMLLSREALLKTGSNGAIESANKATTEEKSPDHTLETLSAKLDQIVACMAKGTASGPAKSKDPNEKCYLPHHSRHTNAQCFKQHPELRNKAENIEAYPAYAFSARTAPSESGGTWLIDTGCSRHCAFDRQHLTDYNVSNSSSGIQLGDDRVIPTPGIGTATVNLDAGLTNLKGTLHAPLLGRNLLCWTIDKPWDILLVLWSLETNVSYSKAKLLPRPAIKYRQSPNCSIICTSFKELYQLNYLLTI